MSHYVVQLTVTVTADSAAEARQIVCGLATAVSRNGLGVPEVLDAYVSTRAKIEKCNE